MKRSWDCDYIWRKTGGGTGPYEWATAKLRELQEQTGVKWAYWTANGRYKFEATWTGAKPKGDHRIAALIDGQLPKTRAGINRYRTFTALSEALKIPLKDVIAVCLWMTKVGYLNPNVGRCGGACMVGRR